MAVAAFKRIIGLNRSHSWDASSKRLSRNFSRVVIEPKSLPQTSLDAWILRAILWVQVMRHVAVGTGGTHARAVGVVDGRFQFLKDIVAHLVAADAEFLGVGRFQGGVEASPEHDPGQEPADGEKAEAERLAW